MKYTKGQKVKRIDDNNSLFTKGKIYTIVDTYHPAPYPLAMIDDKGDKCSYSEEVFSKYFKVIDRTWDTLEVGDILLDVSKNEFTVLSITGLLYGLSQKDNPSCHSDWYTKEEFDKYKYTIKQDTPEDDITELTLEEVAELKGIPVDKLRIKD